MPVVVGRTKIGTSMSYLCPSCQPTPKPSRQISKQISANISKHISARTSKQISKYQHPDHLDNISSRISPQISVRISKQISARISKRISTKISKQISTSIPNHWHQHVSPLPQLCFNSTTRYPPRYQNDWNIHVLVFHAALKSCSQPDLTQSCQIWLTTELQCTMSNQIRPNFSIRS